MEVTSAETNLHKKLSNTCIALLTGIVERILGHACSFLLLSSRHLGSKGEQQIDAILPSQDIVAKHV